MHVGRGNGEARNSGDWPYVNARAPFLRENRHPHAIPFRSIGVVALEESQEHDLEIEEEVPVLEIPEVAFDALGEVGVAAESLDLRPAGHAGFGLVAGVVVGDVVLEVADEFGALGARADETHLASEHVPELGQLVDVPFADEGTNAEAAGIFLGAPAHFTVSFGVELHGADFDDIEGATVLAGTALAIEDGAARLKINDGTEQGNDGGGEHQAHECAEDVERALEQHVEAVVQRQAIHAENGGAGHRFQIQTGDKDAEAGRDDLKRHHFTLAEVGEFNNLVAGAVHVCGDDHVHIVTGKQLLHVFEIAEAGHFGVDFVTEKVRAAVNPADDVDGGYGVLGEGAAEAGGFLVPTDDDGSLLERFQDSGLL